MVEAVLDSVVLSRALLGEDERAVAVLEKAARGELDLIWSAYVYPDAFQAIVSLAETQVLSTAEAHAFIRLALSIPCRAVPVQEMASAAAVTALARRLRYRPACDVTLAESRNVRLITADPDSAAACRDSILLT